MKLSEVRRHAHVVKCLESMPYENQLKLVRSLPSNQLNFLARCLHCLIYNQTRLRLTPSERTRVRSVLQPHHKELKYISSAGQGDKLSKQLRRQTGRGFLLSALITAAIPLISSVINKLLGKKK